MASKRAKRLHDLLDELLKTDVGEECSVVIIRETASHRPTQRALLMRGIVSPNSVLLKDLVEQLRSNHQE